MDAKLSQTKEVLRHLKEHGSITTYEAFTLYGATRLSAIIYELRHRYECDITSQPKIVETRYGHRTHIVVYKLETEEMKGNEIKNQSISADEFQGH